MAWWIFQNVVFTSALAAVVLAVGRMSRLGPVARHALWVLVLVKFVTPPIVAWPWAAPDPLRLAALEIGSASTPGSVSPVIGIDRAPSTGVDDDAQGGAEMRSSTLQQTTIAQQAAIESLPFTRPSTWPWLLALWAAGSLGLAVIEGIRWLRLRRAIVRATPGNPTLISRAATLAASMGVGEVRVLTVPHGSPFVYGVGRPLLLWPAELASDSPTPLSDACIDGLLVHELAHIKRRDHLIGWIELAASIVWWWNPVFWFVRAARREQAELACDAWVVAALPNGRRAYAESILALSAMPVSGTPAIAVGVRASSRRVLERRLVMIMKGRAALRLPASGILTLALLSLATLPTWAAGSRTQGAPTSPAAVTAPLPQTPSPSAQLREPATIPPPVIRTTRLPMHPAVSVSTESLAQGAPPPPPPPQAAPAGPPPPPARRVVSTNRTKEEGEMVRGNRTTWRKGRPLPPEGGQLLESYTRDVEEIHREIERKSEARRESLIKELEALMDKYTKAGQLDEAVQIRDFLRAGAPKTKSLERISFEKKPVVTKQ